MPLPSGVTTATVTFGAAVSYLGTEARIAATLSADRSVVHAATGMSIHSAADGIASEPGLPIVLQVPHVDQPGFIDSSGSAVTGWAYILQGTITFPAGQVVSFKRMFQALQGQTLIDLDVVPDGPTTPAVSAPTATVLSVAGLTGTVAPAALADALENDLSATYPADQVDLVELVRLHAPRYVSMKFAKTAANTYQLRFHDGVSKGAVYQFIKDANDDYIKVDGCYIGFGDSVVAIGSIASPGDTTGVWNTATASYYTTEVGATYTETVAAGAKLQLRLTKETRGGIWSVAVDGGAPVTVSCWAATTTGALDTIATGLNPAVSHTVVCTFMGDDPQHAPSSTPSRGYIRKDDALGSVVGTIAGAATTKMVLADGSNKEFAYSASKGGSVNWIPEHDAIGSAFKITDPIFYFDGAAYNVAGMAVGAEVALSKFQLAQRFYGKIGATNVYEMNTRHTLDANGLLTFDGRMVALTSVDQITGYCMMLPASQTFANEFITGILNSQVNSSDELEHSFTAERDNVYSGAIISATNRELIGAGRLRNPRLTYRRGKLHRPTPGSELFVWHRATKPKMYWKPFLNHPMAAGDAYVWGFDLMVADIDAIYSLVKS